MTNAAFRSPIFRWAAVPVLAVAIPLVTTAAPASAGRYVPISGSGTDWSSIAITQWAQTVRPRGIVVNYNPDGSAEGRQDYMANQDDFAASDPPFRSGRDKLGGLGAEHPSQGYSYIPDVAGGTAFSYHVTVHGHLVTNLRLTPRLLFEIFTGKITNWDAPQIKAVYRGTLPNLPITPVIPSNGDGGTYFLSLYFATVFTSQWNAFCEHVDPSITPPCGTTEFYPIFGNAKAENGAASTIAYIGSPAGNGAIGYTEYGYPLATHLPVVKLRNPAGRYVLPTTASVTAALTKAVINEQASSPNFLQQNLTKVYANTNPASYPLAGYSYLIVPREGTKLPTNFTKAKGHTLAAFTVFALCAGQRQLRQLGYAPLPHALVSGGVLQSAHIPGHGPIPSLAQCQATSSP
jgi:ABC-type phosphate transport system substrate-binding protein